MLASARSRVKMNWSNMAGRQLEYDSGSGDGGLVYRVAALVVADAEGRWMFRTRGWCGRMKKRRRMREQGALRKEVEPRKIHAHV